MYTASAEPIGTVESKTTIPISARSAMFRECRASGEESQ
jgi:hypothetical protein